MAGVKQTCHSAGCNKLCADRYCDNHRDQAVQRRRDFDHFRNADPLRKLYHCTRWLRTSRYILNRDPICKDCGQALSQVADHIIRAVVWVAQGNDFYDTDNLQGLCPPCHNRKTALETQLNQ